MNPLKTMCAVVALAAAAGCQQAGDDKIYKSESEWKSQLSPIQYDVLRQNGSEPAGTWSYGKYDKNRKGEYHCAACDLLLFNTDYEYDPGDGWPGFSFPAVAKNVLLEEDSLKPEWTDLRCRRCGSHLGHLTGD